MEHEALKKKDNESVMRSYARYDVSIIEGKGAVCYDSSGKRHIDFTAGIGVNALGFCDPKWSAAVAAQASRLQHASNLFYTEPCATLAGRLTERTGLAKVFFANSGAEANECAIKAARKHSFDKYGGGRHGIITLENSFHGRTMATITATGQDSFHKYFNPFLDGFSYVPAEDAGRLREAATEEVCAIMIEPILGEGGVIPLSREFVGEIESLCCERDILLIVDEVQTGVGRTGRFFAYEHYGLSPDIVTAAKALGGGLPIGAALFGEKLASVFAPGDHGSTFGGNPVSCAGGLVVTERLDDAFLGEVRDKGDYMAEKLRRMKGVKEVSGLGMMLGASLEGGAGAKDVAAECARNGLLMLTAKDKLRFLPPLVISWEEIDEGLAVLASVLV
ncbi:MAG: aspartate aminotransferase family protein [Clostridiales Family XIII bacterium]|jgi:acetylornithine/N-succinyldiaminopimelate aminotransferase|nr:aspartate aminotransferase family protein [Clostridiales Family XIII bacterium]